MKAAVLSYLHVHAFTAFCSFCFFPHDKPTHLTCLGKAIDEMQAVGVTTVPARVSAPQRKSRLRNRSATKASNPGTAEHGSVTAAHLTGSSTSTSNSSSKHPMTDQDLEGVDRRAICEDILAGGHVQTFVDFFYLTHRPGPAQGEVNTNER